MAERKTTQPEEALDYIQQSKLLVDEWQKTLRIEDWIIDVVPADHDSGYFACVRVSSGSLRATMEVRDPAYVSKDSPYTNDLEVTIVHELLHLVFTETEAALKHRRHEGHERAIEFTAMGLVACKRGVPVRSLYDGSWVAKLATSENARSKQGKKASKYVILPT